MQKQKYVTTMYCYNEFGFKTVYFYPPRLFCCIRHTFERKRTDPSVVRFVTDVILYHVTVENKVRACPGGPVGSVAREPG
jgi:hypothetical protein